MESKVKKREIETFSVVALGSFNTAIFHPEWFDRNNLVRPEEAQSAKTNIITTDVAIVDFDWFKLQATESRFSVETRDPSSKMALRDLAVSVFAVLEHTPLNAVGLNLTSFYNMSDETTWHQFGDYFVPKDSWNQVMDMAGMAQLQVSGKCYSGDLEIPTNVILKPDSQKHSVSISINHHFENQKNETNSGEFLHSTIEEHYQAFEKNTEKILKRIVTDFTVAKPRTRD